MTTDSDNGVSQAADDPGPAPLLVIAHRGASRAHRENTLEAFAGAAELGATWVELDVRHTADRQLAVHHDARIPDGRALIELDRADLDPAVPSLAEALAVCADHGLSVNVEIKSDPSEPDYDEDYAIVDQIVPLLAADPVWPDGRARFLVTSFDWRCLARVRALDPTLPTGQLAARILDVDQLIRRAREAGHVAVNPWDPFVDEAFMASAREAGLAVYPWTVDDPARMRTLAELGVDGIITNVPDVLRAVLDAGSTP